MSLIFLSLLLSYISSSFPRINYFSFVFSLFCDVKKNEQKKGIKASCQPLSPHFTLHGLFLERAEEIFSSLPHVHCFTKKKNGWLLMFNVCSPVNNEKGLFALAGASLPFYLLTFIWQWRKPCSRRRRDAMRKRKQKSWKISLTLLLMITWYFFVSRW